MMNDAQEELLSAYLDNCLSSDERAHVERLVQSDASVRQRLESLKALQAEVRASMVSPGARLGADFPDRVWAAVLAQADVENLPDSHPVRVAQSRQSAGKSKQRKIAWMGGFAALAASLMLVAGLNFDGQEALKNGRQPLDGLATAEPVELGSGPAVDEPQPSSVPDSSTIVAVPTAPAEDVADPQPSAVAQSQPTETLPAAERIAMLDRNDRKMETATEPIKIPSSVDPLAASGQGKIEFAVLLEVELTQRGHDINELEYALETAGITDVQPQPLTREHVGRLVRGNTIGAVNFAAPQETQGDTQLLLLQGSAKRLDRFTLSLFNRRSVVKNVGFQMVMDPALIATIRELTNVDASSVRHADAAALAHHLTFGPQAEMFPRSSRSSFTALTEDAARNMNWTADPPNDEGPDFQTQMLVLVRCPQ